MECSQVYKIFANESHNDKIKLLISKKPRKMQLEFNETTTNNNNNDEQNSNSSSSSNKKWDQDKLNNLYLNGNSCKTTAL